MNSTVECKIIKSESGYRQVLSLINYVFYSSPLQAPHPLQSYYSKIYDDPNTFLFGLYQNDKLAATLNMTKFQQNIRGKLYTSAAIDTIGTYPEFRKRGYASALLRYAIDVMYTESIPVSVLNAKHKLSKFYSKFGYVKLKMDLMVQFQVHSLRVFVDVVDEVMERVDFTGNEDMLYEFMKKVREKFHTAVIVNEVWWEKIKQLRKGKYHIGIVRGQDGVLGMMCYSLDRKEGGGQTMTVVDFYYINNSGLYGLMKYIYLHASQIDTVKVRLPAESEPDLWIPGVDFTATFHRLEQSMVRIVRLLDLNGLKIDGDGEFEVRIFDSTCEWNNGTFKFSSVGHTLSIEQTNKQNQPNFLTIQGITALIYGILPSSALSIHNWGTVTKETKINMNKMFHLKSGRVFWE